MFSNGASTDGYAAVIRDACTRTGMELEVVGTGSGQPIAGPEAVLREFDVVFAKGRSALEALAVGCSVILADRAGCGPLVTSREFDRLRAWNFGIRALQQPHSIDWYLGQLTAIDADDAAWVSERVRSEAGLDAAVERLLALYDEVVTSSSAPAARPSADAARARGCQTLSLLARELKAM